MVTGYLNSADSSSQALAQLGPVQLVSGEKIMSEEFPEYSGMCLKCKHEMVRQDACSSQLVPDDSADVCIVLLNFHIDEHQ